MMHPQVMVQDIVPGDMVSLQSENVYDLLIVLSTQRISRHNFLRFELTFLWIWMEKKPHTAICSQKYTADTAIFFLVSKADRSRATTQAEVVE